jgi:hypothetical protein
MPNGRTGGFRIKLDALAKLLENFPSEAVVAMCVNAAASSQRPRSATIAEVRNLLGKTRQTELFVEEQDHASYIVHLDDNEWIVLGGSSPLYDSMRQHHLQWLNSH